MAEADYDQYAARAKEELPRSRPGSGREPLGYTERKDNTLQQEQTVSEMANEILRRQAKRRANRRGVPIEEAMEAVLNTEAGKQLGELRDGPHAEEGVREAQVGAARNRARERAEDLGERLGESSGSPTHG